MKRIKIMLTSVAVLAVVGGALAFKAQKFSPSSVYCSKIVNQQTICEFKGWQTDLAEGVTTTKPCGNANYFSTKVNNCTNNPITPAATLTLYPTSAE